MDNWALLQLDDRSLHLVEGKRQEFLSRLTAIEAKLSEIEREGAAIKKHCTATPEKIQAATREFKK